MRTKDQVAGETEHHLRSTASKPTDTVRWQPAHRVATPQSVAQEGADEDTWKSNSPQQQLPLGRLLHVTVMDNARDNRAGEDTVRNDDLLSDELEGGL